MRLFKFGVRELAKQKLFTLKRYSFRFYNLSLWQEALEQSVTNVER
jgi:hypothetical protein